MGWELEEAASGGVRLANNTVQKLVGFTTIRLQVALTEDLVRFRVLEAGGAFQVLLEKPWKAQIGAIHFYEVDRIFYPLSTGRWGSMWNQNPKATPTFTAVPDNPADLASFLSNLDRVTDPATPLDDARVLMVGLTTRTEDEDRLAKAIRTPIAEDDGLLLLPDNRQVLLPFSGPRPAPDDPASMAALLRKEAWRRELTLHPRSDLLNCDDGGPTFLSEQEVERATTWLEERHKEDPVLAFWATSDPQNQAQDWEEWSKVKIPPLDPAILRTHPSKKAKIHLYLQEDNEEEGTADGEEREGKMGPQKQSDKKFQPRTEAERVAEILASVKVGDDKVTLSREERDRVEKLLTEYSDIFAFCLKDVKSTDTIEHHILTPRAIPTRARDRKLNNPDQRAFSHDMVDQLLEANFVIHVQPHLVTWSSSNTVAPKADKSKKLMTREEIRTKLEESITEAVSFAEGWTQQEFDQLPDSKPTKFRLCHAFLDLNDATVGAPFPVGDLEGKIDRLAGHDYLSCFDMHSVYFAIRIAAEDILKTTFAIEDRGYFAYKRMLFGLKGAPATFCELIATVFEKENGKSMEVWMDNLATASDNFESHLSNIRTIMHRCREHKLSLNPAKCQLFASSMVWCGTHVSKEGRQPDKAKVQAVVEWPAPKNPHEVLRFLNFAGYYRPLIKDFAKLTEPLQRLTKGVQVAIAEKGRPARRGAYKEALKQIPKDWKWGEEQQHASVLGMGAILSQDFTYEHPESGRIVTRRHPITYASRSTKASEKRYAAFLLELVCVKWALEKFHKYIFGRPIKLVTDCQALAGILSLQKVSPAHARWREFILGHDIVGFTHKPGKQNQAADELSQRAHNPAEPASTPEATLPFSWEDYLEEKDEKLRNEKQDAKEETRVCLAALEEEERDNQRARYGHLPMRDPIAKLEAFFMEENGGEGAIRERFRDDPDFEQLVEYLLTLQTPRSFTTSEAGKLRKDAKSYFIAPDNSLRRITYDYPRGWECIPLRERQRMVMGAHEWMNHAGRDRLLAHLFERFYWPKMSPDVLTRIKACSQCQHFGRQVFRSKLHPISVLKPMQMLSMDYLSLPEHSKGGFKSVLVVIDYFSRYIWAFKFKGAGTGLKTTNALEKLFTTFGRPEVLMSDNGSHFVNQTVEDFLKENGVEQQVTPAYSPHTNGLVERANALIISALEKETANQPLRPKEKPNWAPLLEAVVSRLNDRVVSSTGQRPASLMFGYERRMPKDSKAADEALAEALEKLSDSKIEALVTLAEAEGRRDAALETLVKKQEQQRKKVDEKHKAALRAVRSLQTDELAPGDLVMVHAS
ncbi:hypothetical protein JCM11251_007340 [Rhodosporidiobolus azoricus]